MSIVPRISHGILSLAIGNKEELLKAYMPFINNGGLFIPTTRSYQLGEEVFMLMTLMDEPDKIPVTGKVVWVTPRAAQGGRIPGIGIQLSSEDVQLVGKLETYLAGALGKGRRTNTL
ncbi:type 4 fimbrial biogenesis protein PilZ [Marinobacterium zhoushanense]|uniref:Type 4 fimbrial biogenesis protein PilZ n=1 Tax=Marinobacterium zhoushanense TaxID=1679163 RepID=A0ABQ1KA26_9GAMM|nr:PilZ domain-containing protein [Marinobacterium zhoushanense]GGB92884.1 type 4 fimbrial biogenesis protein PilZ [Marinobacterium zhoushanense]